MLEILLKKFNGWNNETFYWGIKWKYSKLIRLEKEFDYS